MTNVEQKSKKNKDYILAVASNVCKTVAYPKKNDYVKAILDEKSKEPEFQNQKLVPEDIRSGVSKAIDNLVLHGDFVCLLNDHGKKYYAPNKGKYKQRKIRDNIHDALKDKIKVVDKDILIVSYNVCAIKIEPIGDVKVKALLEGCLGDKCFHILKNQTLLYIMLKNRNNVLERPNKQSEEYMIIKGLGLAIRKLYNLQNGISTKKGKNKLVKKN